MPWHTYMELQRDIGDLFFGPQIPIGSGVPKDATAVTLSQLPKMVMGVIREPSSVSRHP